MSKCFFTEAGKIALNFIKQQGTEGEEGEIVVKPEVDLGTEVTEVEGGTSHIEEGDVGDIVTGLPEGTELVSSAGDDQVNISFCYIPPTPAPK